MKFNLKLQKLRREQFEYSKVHYCKKLKQKYLSLLMNTYNDQVSYQQNQFKADQFYYQRKMSFTWKLFKNGIKYSKLEQM